MTKSRWIFKTEKFQSSDLEDIIEVVTEFCSTDGKTWEKMGERYEWFTGGTMDAIATAPSVAGLGMEQEKVDDICAGDARFDAGGWIVDGAGIQHGQFSEEADDGSDVLPETDDDDALNEFWAKHND